MTFNNIFIETINALINAYLAYLFLKIFLGKPSSLTRIILFSILSFSILCVSLLCFKETPYSYILFFLSNFAMCFVFKAKTSQRLLFTTVLVALIFITEMIIGLLFMTAFDASMEVVKQGILYISGMLLSKLFMFLVIFIIHFLKHKPYLYGLQKKYAGIISFPLSSALVLVLQHALIINNPIQNKTLYYFLLVGDLALLVSNMVVFDYIDSLYENTLEKSKNDHANKLIEIQTAQYRSMVESSYKLRKVKHDFRNFCVGLVYELEAGETKSVIEKLNKVYEKASIINTGAKNVIETLIHIKTEEAAKKDVSISFNGCKLPKLRFSDVDLAIILGNAIDNAVEAAEKVKVNRIVNIFVTFNNDIIIIKITNPVIENIDTQKMITTKHDKASHGFGIISIKQLVDKYSGEVMFKCSDLIFTTSIIMSNIPAALVK